MISALKNVPLFSTLNDADIASIERYAEIQEYPNKHTIFQEGDKSDSLFIINKGRVKVYCRDDQGKEVILNTMGPGEYFGELSLIDESPRSASIITTGKSSFTVMTKTAFIRVLKEHPQIALSLLTSLTSRIRDLTENVKTLALLDVYGRINKTLSSLAQQEGDRLVVRDKLTQQDLANRIGASREMVAKIFKELISGGYIELEGKVIYINKTLPDRF